MKILQKIKTVYNSNKKIYKELLFNDLRARYNGSLLGVIWGIIQPVVTILIYWLVFQYGLRSGERPDGMPYVIYMVAGAIPWFFFSDAWGGITSVFLDYSYLVKKLNFDVKLLPFVRLGSALIIHLVFLAIGSVIINFGGYYANWYYIQTIYYMFATSVFVVIIGLFTSALAVYIRDILQFIGIIMQIGFWANPICWGNEILSGKLEILFKLNPMYYCIQGYRDSLLYDRPFWEQPIYTLYFWSLMVILFFISKYAFKKLRPYFADVM